MCKAASVAVTCLILAISTASQTSRPHFNIGMSIDDSQPNSIWLARTRREALSIDPAARTEASDEPSAVISQSGRYFLANDLKEYPDFGISIAVSSVKVELRGHTVQGTLGDNAMAQSLNHFPKGEFPSSMDLVR